ncbi:hypothetical protein HK100_012261, partial [Physocladia obscura]
MTESSLFLHHAGGLAPKVAAAVLSFYVYFVRSGPVFSVWYKFFGLFAPPKSKSRVEGFTTAEFESLRKVLKNHYDQGNDLGSQVAVYVDGELVADLAGGYTDKTYKTPYNTNTLQQVFSSSKFVTSMVFLHLINTNRIKLSDPIVKYWPEFGQGGKEHVTVGLLLQHHGGVAFLDPKRIPTLEEMLDLDALAAKIAGQPHNFGGKEVSAYHAVTRGWFLNEVARRATGMTVREIMYKEILPKMNAGKNYVKFGVPHESDGLAAYEFHYGVPDEPRELAENVKSRVAPLDSSNLFFRIMCILMPTKLMFLIGMAPIPPTLVKSFLVKGSVENKVLISSGPKFTGEKNFPWNYNDPTCRRSQSPSFSGLTNARFLARLAELVRRSQSGTDRTALVSKETFDTLFAPRLPEIDLVLNKELAFTKIGTGYFTRGFGFGTPWAVGDGEIFYGWAGAGGSIVVFNLEHRISFSFTMNFAQLQSLGDIRSWSLIGEVLRIHGNGIVVVAFGGAYAFQLYFLRSGPVFSIWYKFFGLNAPPSSKSQVQGFTTPEFESLRGIMENTFEEGNDLGSQATVYVNGELVADLAGGYTDTTYQTQYTINTLQQVFSSSKFVTSTILQKIFLYLIDTNRIKLSDKVV